MTIDLQSHKLQLSPTQNVSGGVYSNQTGNDATNLLIKHNSLVDAVETELNSLQEKVLSYFFPTLPSFGHLLHTDKNIIITKLKTYGNSNGAISLLTGDPGLIMVDAASIRTGSAMLGYSWNTTNITQNNIVYNGNVLYYNASGSPTNVVVLIHYI